jgi:hypothetical protein
MRTLTLNADEMTELMRDCSGQGGWQGLIESLQAKLHRSSGALTLSVEELERIPRYAFDYGNGGWEAQLKRIFERHLGPSLGR